MERLGAWTSGFHGTSQLFDLAVFDPGTGPTVFVGGSYTRLGSEAFTGLAQWGNNGWTSIPTNGWVRFLRTVNVGGTETLFVAGDFSVIAGVSAPVLASWDGNQWQSVGAGLTKDPAAMAWFPPLGLVAAENPSSPFSGLLKSWNGTQWVQVATPADAFITDMEVLDDGSGPRLIVAGYFSSIGGIVANRVAAFDGVNWSPLGSGLNAGVNNIQVFDDGSGPRVYATGNFPGSIARWNGTAWETVGGGAPFAQRMAVVTEGGVSKLYVAARPTAIGTAMGVSGSVARWTGSAWETLDGPTPPVTGISFAVWDDGQTQRLCAGVLENIYGSVATYNPSVGWSALTTGPIGTPRAATTANLGSGLATYVVGIQLKTQDGGSNACLQWDGCEWTRLPGDIDGAPSAIGLGDDGTGPTLWAGTSWSNPNMSLPFNPGSRALARWDGANWNPVGSGLGGASGAVRFIRTWDDGSGLKTYVGAFDTTPLHPGLYTVSNGALTPVGGGLSGDVNAAVVFDDGTGEALYVGGSFNTTAGAPANLVARWNGATWAPVGFSTYVPGSVSFHIRSLAVHDDGSGPRLFAAGVVEDTINGTSGRVWRWSGTGWAVIGDMEAEVLSIVSHDDGMGAALYAGGRFIFVLTSSTPASGIARWNGAGSWSGLGTGATFGGDTQFIATDPVFPRRLVIGGAFRDLNGLHVGGMGGWRVPGPMIATVQGAPGTPVTLLNAGLTPGRETYNVFSPDLCPNGVNQGPLLGLCSNDIPFIVSQVTAPLGTLPFRYTATAPCIIVGSYLLPPVTLDGVTFQLDQGQITETSPAVRFTIL